MSKKYPLRGGNTTLMSLGNSLMSVYPNYDKNVDGPMQSYIGGNSFQAIGNALANSPAFMRGSAATGGYLVQEIIDVHLPKVLELRPAICVVDGGGNNIGSDANTTDALVGLKYIYEQLQAVNIKPILVSLPLLGQTDATVLGRIQRINAFIYNYANTKGLPVLDFCTILTNPATGIIPTGWADDGEHPNAVGTRAIAKAFAVILQKLLPTSDGAVFLAVNNNLNFNAKNALLDPDTGNATIPAWHQLYPDTTHTLVSGPVGRKFTMTSKDANEYVLYGDGVPVSPGDEVMLAVRVTAEVESLAGAYYDIALIGSDTGSGLSNGYNWKTDLADRVVVMRATLPENSTDTKVRGQFKIGGANGAKLTVSQVTVRNLTKGAAG